MPETLAHVFSCEFCEIFKNTFFTEHLWWLLLMFAGVLDAPLLYSWHLLKFSMLDKSRNTEFFLVRIFPHSDWIRTRKSSVFGHFFKQCVVQIFSKNCFSTLRFNLTILILSPLEYQANRSNQKNGWKH